MLLALRSIWEFPFAFVGKADMKESLVFAAIAVDQADVATAADGVAFRAVAVDVSA